MQHFLNDILTWYFELSQSAESSNLQRNWRLEAAWNWQTFPVVTLMLGVLALAVWLLRVSLRRRSIKLFSLLLFFRISILFLMMLIVLQVQLKTIIFAKPTLILLIDSSASMSLADNYSSAETKRLRRIGISTSSETRIEIVKQILSRTQPNWLQNIEQRYETQLLTFDSKLHETEIKSEGLESRNVVSTDSISINEIQAIGPTTDFQSSLDELIRRVRNRSPSAVVLFSDGRATAHSAAAVAQVEIKLKRMQLPVFSVGIGVPANSIDIAIKEIELEPVGFTGNDHPLTISISANESITGPIQLTAKNSATNEVVNSISLESIGSNKTMRTMLVIPKLTTGRNDFRIEVNSSIGETNLQNNRQNIRIWGRDAKLNVLLIEQEPRWEFRHLKTALERDRNLHVETFLLEGDPAYAVEDRTALAQLPESLEKYDAIVLGNINFNLLPQDLDIAIDEFVENQGGLLLLSGERSFGSIDLTSVLSELHPSLSRTNDESQRRQVAVRLTPEGQAQRIFPIRFDQDLMLPEVYPQGFELLVKPSVLTLLEGQRTDPSLRSIPLVLSMRYGSGLVTQHLVDDIWRWRMIDDGEFFRKYWAQTIRNLCRQKLLEQLPSLELITNQNVYRSLESAEVILIDRNDQLKTTNSLTLIWMRNGQVGGEVALNRLESDITTFTGTIPTLKPGSYSLTFPSTEERYSQLGTRFEVIDSNVEEEYFPLQEDFLTDLSKHTEGKFYFPWELAKLPADLPETQYTRNSETLIIPIWNRWELILPLLSLFALEWIVRRRSGLD